MLSCAIMLLAANLANSPAHAQPATPSPPHTAPATFDQPARDVLALLQGNGDPAALFTPAFLAAVPADQLTNVIDGLQDQFGAPLALEAIRPMDGRSAQVDIRFERAVVTFTIGVLNARLAGLFVTGSRKPDDSIAQIVADIAALPGTSGLIVQQLSPSGLRTIAAHKADQGLAMASTFKLYVLAEIDRAVRSGERRWSDVMELTQKSHPSGISQDWPDRAPMTLQTLATLMISISDNGATDTLIAAIGQKKLAAMVRTSGHARPDTLLPLLTSQQVTGLKMPANAGLRDRFLAASERDQLRILAQSGDVLTLPRLDLSVYTGGPNQIDTIEWFASPADIARLLARLARDGDPVTQAILKINPGIAPVNAGRWRYLGYKGGSEPGIMAMSFIAQAEQDTTYLISAMVNNSAQDIDQPGFIQLMTRLLDQLRPDAAPPNRR